MRSLRRIVEDQRFEISRPNSVVLSYESQIHSLQNSLEQQEQTSQANSAREAQTSNVTGCTEPADASSLLDTLGQQAGFLEHCATHFKRLKEEFKEKEAAFRRAEAEFRQEEEKLKALKLGLAKCSNIVQQISSTISTNSSMLDGNE